MYSCVLPVLKVVLKPHQKEPPSWLKTKPMLKFFWPNGRQLIKKKKCSPSSISSPLFFLFPPFLSLLPFLFFFFFFLLLFYSPPPWFFMTARILHEINTIFNLILSLVDIPSKISTPTACHTHYTK